MAGTDIHIVGGDLETLAASREELRYGIGALDTSGPLERVGTEFSRVPPLMPATALRG